MSNKSNNESMGKRKYFTEEERKAARNETVKRWKEKHRDKVLEGKKQYYLKHKKEIKQENKQWRDKHPNYMSKYMLKYREEHPECDKERYQTPMGRASNLVSNYQLADRNANRGECTLSAKWVVENIFTKPCHYCGKEGWDAIGCDRIDNSKPHTPDNVVPCCYECNCKRNRTPYDEYIKKRVT